MPLVSDILSSAGIHFLEHPGSLPAACPLLSASAPHLELSPRALEAHSARVALASLGPVAALCLGAFEPQALHRGNLALERLEAA